MAWRRVLLAFPLVPLLVTLSGLLLGAGGCERTLFPENAQRTPYERYQILRGKYRPATEEDVYGINRPALRSRLRPLE
ncbi:MAG: hypothetical protein CMJ18_12480 [Phycisphaeraceae bacterium]|nr:hypothetical protein [Phycisphaeraceae bacterium]